MAENHDLKCSGSDPCLILFTFRCMPSQCMLKVRLRTESCHLQKKFWGFQPGYSPLHPFCKYLDFQSMKTGEEEHPTLTVCDVKNANTALTLKRERWFVVMVLLSQRSTESSTRLPAHLFNKIKLQPISGRSLKHFFSHFCKREKGCYHRAMKCTTNMSDGTKIASCSPQGPTKHQDLCFCCTKKEKEKKRNLLIPCSTSVQVLSCINPTNSKWS